MRAVLLLLVILTFASGPATAQSALPGVRFDRMPVGCRIHASYSTGERVIDTYLGRKRAGHVIRTTGPDGQRVIRTITYNAEGYMIRKDWAGGKWETFAPYSCFDRPGRCTYTYRNADGAQKVFRGQVARRGDRIVSRGGFEGEPAFPDTVVTPGPFNLGERFSDGSLSFRVTRYENCGDGLPSS